MVNHHRRSISIPPIRLSQPLPPLPMTLNEIRPRPIPQITIIPYHDEPSAREEIERSPKSPLAFENQPPSYEPMYDYLRSQQRPMSPLSPNRQTYHIVPVPGRGEHYRDDPFVIAIDQHLSQPPPPSYEELCMEEQNRQEVRSTSEFDVESAPAEEICKFIAAMLLVALTVASVGMAFHWGNWGKFGCSGPGC